MRQVWAIREVRAATFTWFSGNEVQKKTWLAS